MSLAQLFLFFFVSSPLFRNKEFEKVKISMHQILEQFKLSTVFDRQFSWYLKIFKRSIK